MHHVVLQSFLIIHQPKIGANEVDGKMARARRWQRNFSIVDLAREWCRKKEGEGSFYTSRGQRKWLGSMPSVSLREIEQISRKGHTI
jgi:hypothetical protein